MLYVLWLMRCGRRRSLLVPQLLWAQSAGQFEQPPIINATQLLPESALSGPGFHVEQLVPTNGAMGQYTIVADASVFQDDAGTYRVESLDLLKIRLSEIPAIAYLENVSKTGVFANALAQSAERPVADCSKYGYPSDGYGNRTTQRDWEFVWPRHSRVREK